MGINAHHRTRAAKLSQLLQSCSFPVLRDPFVPWRVQVGIDINLAASHDWIFGPLQFVAGLGPRKAGAIQRAIQSAGRVGTRKDLYASIRVMDKKVFINSAGFIRVRGSGQAASGIQHLDPLDDTRIHPESYQVRL